METRNTYVRDCIATIENAIDILDGDGYVLCTIIKKPIINPVFIINNKETHFKLYSLGALAKHVLFIEILFYLVEIHKHFLELDTYACKS